MMGFGHCLLCASPSTSGSWKKFDVGEDCCRIASTSTSSEALESDDTPALWTIVVPTKKCYCGH